MELQLTHQQESIKLDLDSPTTRDACLRLGIDTNELVQRPKKQFAQSCENPKVLDLRYKNYLSRYQATVKSVLDEKKTIQLKGQQSNIMNTMESKYISLPFMDSLNMREKTANISRGLGNSVSVRNLRGIDLRLGDSLISQGGLRLNQNHRYSALSSFSLKSSQLKLPQIGRTIDVNNPPSPTATLKSGRNKLHYDISTNSPQKLSSDIYSKISTEFQKMTELKRKQQIDLKNHLLLQRKNEEYMQKLEAKLKRIEEQEKEELEDINERKIYKDTIRKQKYQRVLSDMQRNQEDREMQARKFNEERLKQVQEKEQKLNQQAKQEKLKHDQELDQRQEHNKKLKELEDLEANTCLNKLKDLDDKITKSNKSYIQRQQEKQAYLKAQALMTQLKNEQARKQFEENRDKQQEKVIKKIQKTEDQINFRNQERDESIKYRSHKEQQKGDQAIQKHEEKLRGDEEFRKVTEERLIRKINRARLGNSMTAPKLLSDLVMNNGHSKFEVSDDVMLKYESKKLRDNNIQENLRREQKKRETQKLQILEKEYAYSQKIQLAKIERQMLEKCKLQTQTQAIRSKEDKQQFIQRLKAYSVTDQTQKKKAQKMAQKLAGDVDLTDVFQDQGKFDSNQASRL
eukprot:403336794